MRVLHTESSLGWGGQENRTLNEMIGLRDLGHEPGVACQPGARLAARARGAGFQTFEVRMRGAVDFPAILSMRRVIREFRPDVVNTHSGRDAQIAGMAARLLPRRPRVVRTRHLALPITSRFSYNLLSDRVVAVSRFVADYLASAGVPRSRIVVVHTGIDFSDYAPRPSGGGLRDELGFPPGALLVGAVAILRMKKGHFDLIEAVPLVAQAFPDAHFIIAGDGPQHERIAAAIRERGLEQRVHLLGLRRDVPNVLQSLDVFVLPTHEEALGTAFVEAGAMGLACVGTRVGGVPEVVVDGVTGLLVPPRDPTALGRALCELLGDGPRRRAMGEAAAARVRSAFSRAAMAAGMLEVYRDCIAEAG